ncbi:predicted protein [Histoplasma capsulatum H143]|uniref:Uncharacterized protein n=1 Tax=Ajellomyces capsulatus (strain H143) TaxID=544712 RepID=C6HI72_AJECH|nr:predicted protein [Histoplasma capsulatum H143]
MELERVKERKRQSSTNDGQKLRSRSVVGPRTVGETDRGGERKPGRKRCESIQGEQPPQKIVPAAHTRGDPRADTATPADIIQILVTGVVANRWWLHSGALRRRIWKSSSVSQHSTDNSTRTRGEHDADS